MKKVFPFILLICMVQLVSCSSKEEKAEKLIKNELSKTLYDFESYQPIETTVKEAKMSIYNDSACWRKGMALAYTMQLMVKYCDEYKKAKEHMDIWGRPTSYSSTYSDNQYYKYEKEYEENLEKGVATGKLCKELAGELKDYVAKLDTTEVIGWEVSHRFRCKTKGGYSSIGDYRYIISKDFKSILLREDKDDDSDKNTREVLETILSDNYWNE